MVSSPAPYEGVLNSAGRESDRILDSQPSKTKILHFSTIWDEFLASARIVFNTKLNWLLLFAPLVIIGSRLKLIGEAPSFCFSGLALIPFAERLSLVTEQVAEHTNGTIGALLNATFGNAPELLMSSAALRSGFYRIIQLTLLGSVLTNLLLVFGLSCLVGGIQWQTQEIRVNSGNVSIAMLLIAALGLTLPTVLKKANESRIGEDEHGTGQLNVTGAGFSRVHDVDDSLNSADVTFSRFNAVVMIVLYVAYLIFQLGTHKDEFDYGGSEYAMFGGGHNVVRTAGFDDKPKQKRGSQSNEFCMRYWSFISCRGGGGGSKTDYNRLQDPDMWNGHDINRFMKAQCNGRGDDDDDDHKSAVEMPEMDKFTISHDTLHTMNSDPGECNIMSFRRRDKNENTTSIATIGSDDNNAAKEPESIEDGAGINNKCKLSDYSDSGEQCIMGIPDESSEEDHPMTMRMGILWLGIITIGVSLMSSIIVDTIDGFARESNMSEVFTSVVIIPYFSNIAEQVSAVIFAHKNKMDLCIGVTVGSAIQIALCVLPGCVLVGWYMDRPMTLYFRIYETCCLLLGVLCMAAVLQGGTTNWLVGVFFIGIYLMIAAGFALHEQEELSIVFS